MAALISVFVSLTLQRYNNRGICKKADRVFWCGWWTVGGQVSLQWQESFPQGYKETADRICDWDRTGKSESLGTKLCRGDDKQLWGNEDEERSQIARGGNNDQVEIHHQSWLLNTQPHNLQVCGGERRADPLKAGARHESAQSYTERETTAYLPKTMAQCVAQQLPHIFISLFCRSIFTHGHNSLLRLQLAFSKKIPDFCLIR